MLRCGLLIALIGVLLLGAGCPRPADNGGNQALPPDNSTAADQAKPATAVASPTTGATLANGSAVDAGAVVDSLFDQRSAIENEIEVLRSAPELQPELLAQSQKKLEAINDQIRQLAAQDKGGVLKALKKLATIDPQVAGEWTALAEQAPAAVDAGPTAVAEIALQGDPYDGPAKPIEELRPQLKEIWEVEFVTTFGNFKLEVYPELAPIHGIRFLELVDAGFYNDMHIHRIAPGWVVQWGDLYDRTNLTGLRPGEEPPVYSRYDERQALVVNLQDEAVHFPNRAWTVSFAKAGANTASSQPFINLQDNTQLDTYNPPFSPFAYVVEGRDNIERLVSAFGPAMDSAKADLRADLEAKGAPADFIERELQNDLQWGEYVGRYWDPFTVALIKEARIIKRPQ